MNRHAGTEAQRLQQEIADLLATAREADARFGARRAEEISDELKRRKTRLETIRQSRKALEKQAR